MNKDLRDPFASFGSRVSDALTLTNRVKFPDPSAFDFAQGQDFGQRAPAPLAPGKRLRLSKSTCQNWLGGFGGLGLRDTPRP